MERRDELHRHGCSIAKQTILTTHPSGLQTRVSVELANFDAVCVHSECKTKKPTWESPFMGRRGLLGGVSANVTPVLGRRSDAVNEGRLSQQCTPVMRRREMDSPGGSPLPVRREFEEEGCDVDNSVISGWLKFRDNKRWKSRWGVVTKLSPAAGEHTDDNETVESNEGPTLGLSMPLQDVEMKDLELSVAGPSSISQGDHAEDDMPSGEAVLEKKYPSPK